VADIIFFRTHCQITWQSSLISVGSLNRLLIPIGPFFQLQYKSLLYLGKAYWRAAEKCKICYAALESGLPVHKNLLESIWGHFKNNIGECYRVILKKSPIFPIIFTFTARRMENAIAHQRTYLRNSKTNRDSSLDLELFIFVKKILLLSRDTVPLKNIFLVLKNVYAKLPLLSQVQKASWKKANVQCSRRKIIVLI